MNLNVFKNKKMKETYNVYTRVFKIYNIRFRIKSFPASDKTDLQNGMRTIRTNGICEFSTFGILKNHDYWVK